MNKKWLLFIAITIFVTTIAVGTVFAVGSIKLHINGQEVKPLVPLQIVNNRVMAPVRQIAEALGATVKWDNANKTVKILNEKQLDINTRLSLLEFALIPESPEEAANTWAKGAMSRNGALQYAILSDNLQSKYKSDLEGWDWMPGASSPWIDSYQISTGEQQSDGTWKFTIKYHYTDSTKISYFGTSNIQVGIKTIDKSPLPVHSGTEQKWCVVMID